MVNEPNEDLSFAESAGSPPAAMGDRPSSVDHLNFKPYVDALKTFLMQAKPPLTVSIEGNRGAGKSSFMMQLE
ncbi:hypothetical protein [Haladaptatus sp. NG-WS-4]